MPIPNIGQSALFIGTADDDEGDAVVLVVGGYGGNSNEAALLTNRQRQARGEQGDRGGQWRWHQLSPMQEARPYSPGLLLLGRGRVLVCGGDLSRTAEILQLPRDDNDGGVWTLLNQEMTRRYGFTYLVNFDNRIVAVGESLITLVTTRPKQHLFKIKCLHLRQGQGLRRVDNNFHFRTSGKNASTDRSLQALFSNASHFFVFQDAPLETFVWKPLPKIQSDGYIFACFSA